MAANDCMSKPTIKPDNPETGAGAFGIPRYLVDAYWWAYLHPIAIAFFDHPWIVNLILWGHFGRLRRAAFDALGPAPLAGRTLQVACVYADLTPRLAKLRSKVAHDSRVALWLSNSAALGGADGRYDRALIFLLLHEQPESVRRATLSEVVRVVKPGGRVVIVDYHEPVRFNPLRYLMRPLLRWLEPYAMDLWQHELDVWLPADRAAIAQKRLFCGALYQILVLAV
jgi:SAM-dependent methyltransferase